MSASSSSSRKLSSKEKEILLRQRALSLQRQQQQLQLQSHQPIPPPPPTRLPPAPASSLTASASGTDLKSKKTKVSSLSQLLGIKNENTKKKPPPPPPNTAATTTTARIGNRMENSVHKSQKSLSSSSSSSAASRTPTTVKRTNSNVLKSQKMIKRSLPQPPPPSSYPTQSRNAVSTSLHGDEYDTDLKMIPGVKRPTKRKITSKSSQMIQSNHYNNNNNDKRPSIGTKRPRSELENHKKSGAKVKKQVEIIDISDDDTTSPSTTITGGNKNIRKSSSIPTTATTAVTTTTSTTMTSSGGGKLSSLLHQAGISNSEMTLQTASLYSNDNDVMDGGDSILDMDEFYDNLRQWDFLHDFNNAQSRNGACTGTGAGGKNPQQGLPSNTSIAAGSTVAVPDVFRNCRQYQKIWAPLCLQETKAQYLADVKGKLSEGKRGELVNPWVVTVQPLNRDVGANLDAMTVVISPSTGGGGGVRKDERSGGGEGGNVFVVGDLICLARKRNVLGLASEGRLYGSNSQRNNGKMELHGIMGHVEYSRKNVDGLKVRISRQQWIKFCTGKQLQELYMWNLGGNVTNAREFAALCRIHTFSMLPYILCRKMTRAKDNLDLLSDSLCGDMSVGIVDESLQKDDYLKKLGGNAALGEGFVNHVKQKFNVSQLGAISSAACEYGQGGFTLIKGPPGTGKSTTLVAILNALHIRQFHKYYQTIHDIVDVENHQTSGATKLALADAAKKKPRLLVCAPSNNAIDNLIQKIMENGFMDGCGRRYNPSIVRVGVGQGDAVKDVSLESKVNKVLQDLEDPGKVQNAVVGYKSELQRIQGNIHQLRKRIFAIFSACDYPLATEWEIRCDESYKVQFVNHLERRSTFECPPPPKPGESFRLARSQPEYKLFTSRLVKLVDRFASISSTLEQYSLTTKPGESQRIQLETHILDTTHIVFTTLGTAGCLALESAAKFEVVVVDEAAQSVEPSTLVALQLGSSHAVLVGDPQQLPATIFSVSGRTTKYDRSLFQRLEEAGHEVHLLDTQYRMHPQISKFPRHIFYGGYLKDGPNVCDESYGNPLFQKLRRTFPSFQPLTVFNLDSSEQRGGSSVSNMTEAKFALQLYQQLAKELSLFFTASKVSVITPYAQQAALIRRLFSQALGTGYDKAVEINTVDSFQGREADIVILSCVRAAGSKGIGFLSDVRRMNVALTRSKHFLFIIARCRSICANPYWDQLVTDARKKEAVVYVPNNFVNSENSYLSHLETEGGKDVSDK